jgi:hypothetical protein
VRRVHERYDESGVDERLYLVKQSRDCSVADVASIPVPVIRSGCQIHDPHPHPPGLPSQFSPSVFLHLDEYTNIELVTDILAVYGRCSS